MRVALVSEHANPLAALGGADAGGQNVHVAALAGALAQRGVAVTVHTRRDGPGPRRVPLSPGVTVDHVPAGPARPLPKDDLFGYMAEFADELARQWRARPPDVVHAHFWMSGYAARLAARPLGIPVIQTFHALGSVKRRMQGTGDTSPPERIAVEQALAAGADHIIATCSDETFELARLGARAGSMSVVPCGVDLTLFSPEGPVSPAPPGRHRLVTVGRLVPRKGVADVIRAVGALPEAELVIAGGPDRQSLSDHPEASRLARAAHQAGAAGRVELCGRLDRDAVAALLRSADAVVTVPWYEPFGIVPLEAMACGVPVVAANVGGLVSSVVDGVTGVLVPPRQPELLATSLRGLLADPERRAEMGRAGRRRAVTRYGWPRVAALTEQVYRQVAGRARRAPEVSAR